MERNAEERGVQSDESLQENEPESLQVEECQQKATAQADISVLDASLEGWCVNFVGWLRLENFCVYGIVKLVGTVYGEKNYVAI